jgi:hypothetical protein
MFEWTSDVGFIALRETGFEGRFYFISSRMSQHGLEGHQPASAAFRVIRLLGFTSMRSHGSCQARVGTASLGAPCRSGIEHGG